MNLHDLETFVSIARLGGVTRAAGQLHRSQPAITRRIKLLEDHLGAPLLKEGGAGPCSPKPGGHFFPTQKRCSRRSRTERRRCRPCGKAITVRFCLPSLERWQAPPSWNS